jgi:hypothetical protein
LIIKNPEAAINGILAVMTQPITPRAGALNAEVKLANEG